MQWGGGDGALERIFDTGSVEVNCQDQGIAGVVWNRRGLFFLQ